MPFVNMHAITREHTPPEVPHHLQPHLAGRGFVATELVLLTGAVFGADHTHSHTFIHSLTHSLFTGQVLWSDIGSRLRLRRGDTRGRVRRACRLRPCWLWSAWRWAILTVRAATPGRVRVCVRA
jgi:hypothetical protein